MLNNNENKFFSINYFFSDHFFTEVVNIFFTVISVIVFLIYFISSLSFIMQNLKDKTKSPIIFWLDLFIVLIIISIISSLYFYILIFYAEAHVSKAPGLASIIIEYLMLFLVIMFNSIMFVDISNQIKLCSNMKILLNVKGYSFNEISTSFKGLNLYPIINKKVHITKLIVMSIIQIIIIVILYLLDMITHLHTLEVLKIIICIIILVLLVTKSLVNHYKLLLINFLYHNSNLTILKLFNSQKHLALYLSDLISYRVLIDLFGSIPLILFSFIGRLHTYSLIISYFCFICYIILSGSLYLTIDMNNRSVTLTSLIRSLFFYKKIPFILDNDTPLYDDFDFELNEEEAKLFHEVNNSFVKGNINLHLQLAENAHFGSTGLFEVNSDLISDDLKGLRFNMKNNKDVPLINDLEINTPENYYIVCKLLYRYFEQNQKMYMEHEKKMEEEASPFKKLIYNDVGDSNFSNLNITKAFRTSLNKTREYIEGLNRFSRLSKLMEKRFLISYKTGFNNLFSSLEEKEYRESFRKRYAMYEPSKSEFRIESLFNNDFLELFPFYQIHVKDLLNSLEPSNNKDIFINLSNLKESVSLLSSTSGFYTFDSFLFFEIYNTKDFSVDKLKTFVSKYKEYLLEVVKNMDFTFLPIIVGIYNITILGNDKLIILYRHPLSSTQYSHFNQWINFVVTEEPEQIKVSTEGNSVIDVNEIEIKNNIKLPIDQYQELKSILQNDVQFVINTLKLETFPIANLFVGTEKGDGQFYMGDISMGIDSSNYNMTLGRDTINVGKSFNVLLKDPTLDVSAVGGNMMDNKVKKEGGSELMSLFEKDYMLFNNNYNYVIKIYFTNFFRKTCVINERPNEKYKLTSDIYCVYVQDRLLNYLHQTKNLFRTTGTSDASNIRETIQQRETEYENGLSINDNALQ